MTPAGLGIVKFVYVPSRNFRNRLSYAVSLVRRRRAVIFHDHELQPIFSEAEIDFRFEVNPDHAHAI